MKEDLIITIGIILVILLALPAIITMESCNNQIEAPPVCEANRVAFTSTDSVDIVVEKTETCSLMVIMTYRGISDTMYETIQEQYGR